MCHMSCIRSAWRALIESAVPAKRSTRLEARMGSLLLLPASPIAGAPSTLVIKLLFTILRRPFCLLDRIYPEASGISSEIAQWKDFFSTMENIGSATETSSGSAFASSKEVHGRVFSSMQIIRMMHCIANIPLGECWYAFGEAIWLAEQNFKRARLIWSMGC